MKQLPPSLRPEKICASCGRPFQWRRKWAKHWEEVKYCSERCRRHKKANLKSVEENNGKKAR